MPPATSQPLAGHAPRSDRAELAALVRLAGPLVGANLLQMAVFAIDVVFVAKLGAVELAAATLGVFLFSLLAFATIGLVGAAEPLIAAALGAKRGAVREVRRSFRMALWIAAAMSVAVMLVLAQAERLLLLAGQDADVAARAGGFCAILAIATPFATIGGLMRLTAAALGRPGWAFVVTLGTLGIGLFANWALVFGNAGFPALGLAGSALASVIVSLATLGGYAVIFASDRRLRRYRLFGRWWRADPQRARDILRLGAPIALGWIAEGGLFGGAALLMGLISVTAVGAHAVALNLAAFAFQLPFGLAQAATIRVGYAYGARDAVWVGRAGRVAILLAIGVMTATAAILWAVPGPLIALYIDPAAEPAVVMLAAQLLGVAAIFQLADGAQAVGAGVLRGVQDTRRPMMIQVFGYWVIGFGTAAALAFGLGWGAVGVWWGLAAGLAVVSVLLIRRWSARARLGLLPAVHFS
jgi:MATE family multidrug resistance protein